MKTASANLISHIGQEATTLTTCWEITRRDGEVVRLTELDVDLVVPSTTVAGVSVGGGRYLAVVGFSRTAIDNGAGLDSDSVDLTGILNNAGLSLDDVRAGKFNGADLKIFAVNYESLADGVIALKRGLLGDVIVTGSGRFQTDIRSLTSVLGRRIVEKTSPTCRALLGDERCKVPVGPAVVARSTSYSIGDYVRVAVDPGTTSEIYGNLIFECVTAGVTAASAPTYNETPGANTTDGIAVFKAHQAWTRHASVASVTDRRVFRITVTESRAVDDWFNLGRVQFESGPNAGLSMEVKDWVQSTGEVTLFLPMPFTPGVGNVLNIRPGCDRTRPTCRNKFVMSGSADFASGNVLNFRGEPDLPGSDFTLTYPDGQ